MVFRSSYTMVVSGAAGFRHASARSSRRLPPARDCRQQRAPGARLSSAWYSKLRCPATRVSAFRVPVLAFPFPFRKLAFQNARFEGLRFQCVSGDAPAPDPRFESAFPRFLGFPRFVLRFAFWAAFRVFGRLMVGLPGNAFRGTFRSAFRAHVSKLAFCVLRFGASKILQGKSRSVCRLRSKMALPPQLLAPCAAPLPDCAAAPGETSA